jgi:hypothetical protein
MSVLKLPLLVDLQQKVGELFFFHNFLSFNHYFRKHFKLVYSKNVVTVTLTAGTVFHLFICINFWAWGILRSWPACVPTTYEVACDCRIYEKHCLNGSSVVLLLPTNLRRQIAMVWKFCSCRNLIYCVVSPDISFSSQTGCQTFQIVGV